MRGSVAYAAHCCCIRWAMCGALIIACRVKEASQCSDSPVGGGECRVYFNLFQGSNSPLGSPRLSVFRTFWLACGWTSTSILSPDTPIKMFYSSVCQAGAPTIKTVLADLKKYFMKWISKYISKLKKLCKLIVCVCYRYQNKPFCDPSLCDLTWVPTTLWQTHPF